MTIATSDFIPADLDATDFSRLEPLFQSLLRRPVQSREELERWLADRSELWAVCGEAQADLYISMTCNTEDKEASEAYSAFIQTIPPKTKPLQFALDKRQVVLTDELGLDEPPGGRYAVLTRDTRADVEIFRDESVPIETELDTLQQEYQSINGRMKVTFQGRERTLPQMARFLEETDRAVREEAWRLVADRRIQDRDAIDGIFDQMVAKRDRVARNAGFKNFVGYMFKAMHRFDYGPEDCFAYHEACEKLVAPFANRRDEERRRKLGVDAVRPWDVNVDPLGRPPLRPFEGGAELFSKSLGAFTRLDPRLAEMFATLGDGTEARGSRDGANLDLDSRSGKAPGGYQYMRDRRRMPFIFMNAAGLQRDVETMVHEAGHAFHSMLCREDPLVHYRHAPIEFCEVASMAMELLTMPYWSGSPDAFYTDEAAADRARRIQLESSVMMLGWIAAIDAYQHWLYTNPGHSRDQRTEAWRGIVQRFGAHGHFADWSGLEPHRDAYWQRQMHLFTHPFYYIEYGIAQLGALQLWLRSLEEGEKPAVEAYMKALSLGGSRPLPELFRAAGLELDFGEGTIGRVVDRVEAELAKLPE